MSDEKPLKGQHESDIDVTFFGHKEIDALKLMKLKSQSQELKRDRAVLIDNKTSKLRFIIVEA